MNLKFDKKRLLRLTNYRYLINSVLYPWINEYSRVSYSQEGEDRILFSLFGDKMNGFYVDVGAHHPERFSNTNLFYNLGWRGINIDANKDMVNLLRRKRPKDTNVCVGVGLIEKKRRFTIFDEPAINTFVRKNVEENEKMTPFKVKDERVIKILKLSTVLDKYLPSGQEIDFLSIDVEGMDYEVLRSNNWMKYRPHFIAIEIFGGKSFGEINRSKITRFLFKHKYEPEAKTVNTVIFKRVNHLKNTRP